MQSESSSSGPPTVVSIRSQRFPSALGSIPHANLLPPHLNHNTQPTESHAAFTNAMSESMPPGWESWVDWSNVDLLDACYDPTLLGVDLGGLLFTVNLHNAALGCAYGSYMPASIGSAGKGPAEYPSNTETGAGGTAGPTVRYTVESSELPELPVVTNNEAIRQSDTSVCASCGAIFLEFADNPYCLIAHVKATGHPGWACKVSGCQMLFSAIRERNVHQNRPHVSGHGRAATVTPNECIECGESFFHKSRLVWHADSQQHAPYGCECGSRYSRIDVLNRHLDSFSTADPRFPCMYCKRHRGAQGFKRKDHLMQHLRNYHHHGPGHGSNNGDDTPRYMSKYPVCPHSDCPFHRDGTSKEQPTTFQQRSKPFASQSAFTKHMREEHNESTFPCDVAGCDRVRARGYFRQKDMLKHRRQQHPNADASHIAASAPQTCCAESDCRAVVDASVMVEHMKMHERVVREAAQPLPQHTPTNNELAYEQINAPEPSSDLYGAQYDFNEQTWSDL